MKVQLFQLKTYNAIFRFYLMVAVVAITGFLGQFSLAAICGMIIAISAILGIRFSKSEKAVAELKERKVIPMKPEKHIRQAG